MKPAVHCLFPVEKTGGPTRDITKSAKRNDFYAKVSDRACPSCGKESLAIKCNNCGEKTFNCINVNDATKLRMDHFVRIVHKPIHAYCKSKGISNKRS